MDTQKQKDPAVSEKHELTVQKLEARISPRLGANHNEPLLTVQTLESRITPRLAANHNETLL